MVPMIAKLRQLLPYMLMAGVAVSCRMETGTHWTDTLPAGAPVVIVPSAHGSVGELLEREILVWMDVLTPGRMSDIRAFKLDSLGITTVHAIAVIPSGARSWSPLWVMQIPGSGPFRLPPSSSRYRFGKHEVHTYSTGDGRITAAMVDRILLVSDNGQAVEDALTAAGDRHSGFPLSNRRPNPGTVLVQGSLLHQISGLETLVETHPAMRDVVAGLPTMELNVVLPDRIQGPISLDPQRLSPTLRGLTGDAAIAILDRFFPADAILAVEWHRMPEPTQDPYLATLRHTLDPSIGYCGIPSGDGVWIRILRDASSTEEALQALARVGSAIAERDMYRITDAKLTSHLTGGMATRAEYWARVSGNALYLAENPGVISRVMADRTNNRILANDEVYRQVRTQMPPPWSGFMFVRSEGLIPYVQPWLHPEHRLSAYTRTFDAAVLTFRGDGVRSADLELRLFRFANSSTPVVDGWSTNLDGVGTSGPPTLADITGDGRHDVIVTTTGGRLFAFGSDGVELFQAGMDVDKVTGAPVVVDWYGNGDPVIMQGADNRIYAWQKNGTLLPQFPMRFASRLSAPIGLADPSGRNQLELVVATIDKSVARVDRRGMPLPGWPRRMVDISTETPYVGRLWGRRLVVAYADTLVYAWNLNGQPVQGFPVSLPSAGTGALVVDDNHLVVGTLDGDLVAIGPNGYFRGVKAVPVDSTLSMQRVRTGGRSMRLSEPEGDWIGAVGQEGQIRVYDRRGRMVFADELFVSMAPSKPIWVDLNRDGRKELVATTAYGRLHAWDVANRRKIETLPPITTYDPSFSTSFGPDAIPYMVSDTPTGIRVWRLQARITPSDPEAPVPVP
jgi:hypothetical protein